MRGHLDKYHDLVYCGEQEIPSLSFSCGYCGNMIASNRGYRICIKQPCLSDMNIAYLYRCPFCNNPSFYSITANVIYPGEKFGREIKGLPENIKLLYDECRTCYSNECYTSSQMIARTLLMHIAVEQGAKEGETFVKYIDYLDTNGYIPPNGKQWVDFIRKSGNIANHQIVIKEKEETEKVISFLSALLLFIFELPNQISVGETT